MYKISYEVKYNDNIIYKDSLLTTENIPINDILTYSHISVLYDNYYINKCIDKNTNEVLTSIPVGKDADLILIVNKHT